MNTGHFKQKYQYKVDYKNRQSVSYLTYSTWRSILYRCFVNKESPYFGLYVDPRWQNFDLFVQDMGERLSANYQIDRIDNSDGYYKENCRWVDLYKQAANRGKTKTKRTSKYVGVCFSKKDGYWYSYIMIQKKLIFLGYCFNSEKEAIDARNKYIIDNNLLDKGFSLQDY